MTHELPLIAVIIDPDHARRWHGWLIARLRALPGARVALHATREQAPLPRALQALLLLEQTLYGGKSGLAPADVRALPAPLRADAPRQAHVVIDLAGPPAPCGRAHHLMPLFDGIPGTGALLDALMARRAPRLSLAVNGHARSLGLPAVEDFSVLSRAADSVLAQVVAALARQAGKLLTRPATGIRPAPSAPSFPPSIRRGAHHVMAALASKIVARIAGHDAWPRWRVGFRRLSTPAASLRHSWRTPNMRPYTWLKDDGRRFFADPFAITRNGATHVFVEELPHATGKGIISHFTIAANGAISPPRPVLEADTHLSYPFLFAHRGALYMIPESEQARQVRLYRCVAFPHRWEPEAVLVSGRALSDATIHHDGARFWMFATERLPHGSSWDTLVVFGAEQLHGPWREIAASPALLDAGAARPAGAPWRDGTALMRVAQDCRGAYGAGLAICRIDRLHECGFAQTTLATLRPPAPWRGLHTLNVAGDIELIDAIN